MSGIYFFIVNRTDQCAFASSLTPTNAINSQVNANATFTLNQHGSVEYPFVQQQQQQVTTVTWSNHGQGNQSHVNVVSNHNQLMPNIERTGAFCFGAQELPQYVREGLNEELKMESSFGKSRQMMNRKSSRTQFTVKRVERLQENVSRSFKLIHLWFPIYLKNHKLSSYSILAHTERRY